MFTQKLLEDPSHVVRAIGVSGICRVSAVFWEVIPVETIRSLIGVIVQKLAWDSSSADVRHAVIKVNSKYYIHLLLFTVKDLYYRR